MIQVLRHRSYRWLWMAQIASLLGDELRTWAVVYWVFRTSGHSALAQSLIIVAELAPGAFLGSLAGPWVDSWNRKKILVYCDLLRALLSLSFLLALRLESLAVLFGLVSLSATVALLFQPAHGALLPAILPAGEITAALSLTRATATFMSLMGPTIGLAVYLKAGPSSAFILDSLSFLVSALLILLVRYQPGRSAGQEAVASWSSYWSTFAEGIRYIRRHGKVRAIFLLITSMSLGLGILNALGLFMITRELNLPESYLAWSGTAQALGMLLGALALGILGRRLGSQRGLVVFGTELIAAGVALVAAAPGLGLLLGGRGLIGAGAAILSIALSTFLLEIVPEELLGRIGAALENIPTMVMLVALLGAGYLGQQLSIRLLFALSAVVIAVSGVQALLMLRPDVAVANVTEAEAEIAPP